MMKVSDFIVEFLIKEKVTDVFGIPGEISLDFLYSLDNRKKEITVHLSCHEQAAAFGACGYSQAFGKLGVAYSTKGPGFTNLITGIADCYQNSIPVLFITAHGKQSSNDMRFEQNQELDTIQIVSSITKYAARVTKPYQVERELAYACKQALSGRPGPVLLDFFAGILNAEIEFSDKKADCDTDDFFDKFDNREVIVNNIIAGIKNAEHPVFLIGDGIYQSATQKYLPKLVQSFQIPVISSRFSQDLIPNSRYYYGYIGSHGLRYSNFILSKCDMVITLGNRLAYNLHSESFLRFAQNAKIIRIDIDKNELTRKLPNTINYHADIKEIIPLLLEKKWQCSHEKWLLACDELKNSLYNYDTDYPVNMISDILKKTNGDEIITSDVGNNEMWLSRAYAFSGSANRVLYSNTFGSLGCSLPKSIGAYYASRKRVLCFSGDQGLQLNLQELQVVSHEQLPITIIILNNSSSGMIRDRQKNRSCFIHTTLDSGYSVPAFKAIAEAFSIPYYLFELDKNNRNFDFLFQHKGPIIGEIKIDESVEVLPKLPSGCPCQDFEPKLDRILYKHLDGI